MNVLTDEDAKEIHRVLCATVGADYLTIAKAASDFTIKKLAAGVSVEPVGFVESSIRGAGGFHACIKQGVFMQAGEQLYTATAIAAARVQENERCVQACAAKSKEYLARSNRDQHSHGAGLGAAICAELLSALLGKEAQS